MAAGAILQSLTMKFYSSCRDYPHGSPAMAGFRQIHHHKARINITDREVTITSYYVTCSLVLSFPGTTLAFQSQGQALENTLSQ